jgi:hypothetical protein
MYGEQAVSETAIVAQQVRQLPTGSVVIANSRFGTLAVAHNIQQAGHSFVLRMTDHRFKSLCRKAKIVEQGENFCVWSHEWRPNARLLKSQPKLPRDAVLQAWLHEIQLNDELTLQLVTDLLEDTVVLADLYEARVHIEVDIRNFKVVSDGENLPGRSLDTFHQDLADVSNLLAGIDAYRLV